MQLGALPPRAATVASIGGLTTTTAPAPSRFRVVRIVGASTLWDQLQGATTDGLGPRPDRPVEVVYLQTADTAFAAALAARITATFGGPPSEGCGGLDGVAVDRVLTWRAGDRGGVALALPRYRAAGSEPFAQLVAYAGSWRADRIEIGFEPGPCPPSRLEARG